MRNLIKIIIILFMAFNAHAAVEMDGTGDRIENTSLTTGVHARHRFSGWIYVHTFANSYLYEPKGNTRLELNTTGRIRAFRSYTTTPVIRECQNNTLTANTWHHIAASLPNTNNKTATDYHVYVDGVECTYSTSQNGSGLYSNPFGTLYLRLGSNNYDGLIEDFAFWGTTSGSQNFPNDDISLLASSRTKYTPLQANSDNKLLHYWPLDDCADGDTSCDSWKDLSTRAKPMSAVNDAVGRAQEVHSYP